MHLLFLGLGSLVLLSDFLNVVAIAGGSQLNSRKGKAMQTCLFVFTTRVNRMNDFFRISKAHDLQHILEAAVD